MVLIDSYICKYSIRELKSFRKNMQETVAYKFYKCDIRALGAYKALLEILNRNPQLQLDMIILSLDKPLQEIQTKFYTMALQGKNSQVLFKQSSNNIISSLLAIALNRQIHTITIFADDLSCALSYAEAYQSEGFEKAVVCAVESNEDGVTVTTELISI